MDIRSLANLKIAVIGKSTAKAVEEKGIFVDLIPQTYSGKALGRELARFVNTDEVVLIPRAVIGTETVIEPLIAAGIDYDDVAVYDTKEGSREQMNQYDESIDYVAFTSASTVRGFVKLNPDVDYSRIKTICIGKQTAAEAQQYGMQVMISQEATIDSMVDTLLSMYR